MVHFSDIHVTAPHCKWRREDFLNKRLPAWINLRLLGRGFRFRHAEKVIDALLSDLRGGGFDRLIFSGDATAMGFEQEVEHAAGLLGLRGSGCPPGIAVPGNHDYCTLTSMREGLFERHFAPWLVGERVGKFTYPFAQRVGPAWLIAVNSSTANRWPWDARGGVGSDQLRRLEQLLARLEGGPRILVTHYPVVVASGRRERKVRALRDLDALLGVAKEGGVELWLHGHRHHGYYHYRSKLAPFPVICAGSATQQKIWSYWVYTLEGRRLHVVRRTYDKRAEAFRDTETFTWQLPGLMNGVASGGRKLIADG
jgi:3',5'-cyclic AMP phosphodiesterase CpdA